MGAGITLNTHLGELLFVFVFATPLILLVLMVLILCFIIGASAASWFFAATAVAFTLFDLGFGFEGLGEFRVGDQALHILALGDQCLLGL